MGFDDIVNKGKQAFENAKDKVQETLKSDDFEKKSDDVLDSLSDAAKKVVPDEHDAKVDEFRNNLDGKIGQ